MTPGHSSPCPPLSQGFAESLGLPLPEELILGDVLQPYLLRTMLQFVPAQGQQGGDPQETLAFGLTHLYFFWLPANIALPMAARR